MRGGARRCATGRGGRCVGSRMPGVGRVRLVTRVLRQILVKNRRSVFKDEDDSGVKTNRRLSTNDVTWGFIDETSCPCPPCGSATRKSNTERLFLTIWARFFGVYSRFLSCLICRLNSARISPAFPRQPASRATAGPRLPPSRELLPANRRRGRRQQVDPVDPGPALSSRSSRAALGKHAPLRKR